MLGWNPGLTLDWADDPSCDDSYSPGEWVPASDQRSTTLPVCWTQEVFPSGWRCPRKSLSFFPPCLQYRTRLSPVRMYESRFKNKEGNSAENQWKTAFLKELRAESVLSWPWLILAGAEPALPSVRGWGSHRKHSQWTPHLGSSSWGPQEHLEPHIAAFLLVSGHLWLGFTEQSPS